MNGYWKWDFIFLVKIFIFTSVSTSNYIYRELDGNIDKERGLNFSIFIRDFIGIILYGIDGNNKILIEIEKSEFLFQYNRYSIEKSSETICGCSNCSNVYMTFLVKSGQSEIEVECNRKTQLLKIINKQWKDHFYNYPKPINYRNKMNKTYIWMGNIGPYNGLNSITYLPLKNQLSGCLDKLYFNGNRIDMGKGDGFLLPSCMSHNNERICNPNKCEKRTFKHETFDCSLQGLNWQHCKNHLWKVYDHEKSFKSITSIKEISSTIRIEFNPTPGTARHCLFEIQMDDKSIILIITNDYNILLIKKNYWIFETPLTNFNRNGITILWINFINRELNIRIFSNNEIYSYSETLLANPTEISVGLSKHSKICRKFNGSLKFWYNDTFLQPINVISNPTLSSLIFTQYKTKKFDSKSQTKTERNPSTINYYSKIIHIIINYSTKKMYSYKISKFKSSSISKYKNQSKISKTTVHHSTNNIHRKLKTSLNKKFQLIISKTFLKTTYPPNSKDNIEKTYKMLWWIFIGICITFVVIIYIVISLKIKHIKIKKRKKRKINQNINLFSFKNVNCSPSIIQPNY